MFKLFVYTLLICVLASNTDFVRALVYYFSTSSSFEQSTAFMQANGIVERFYMLAGNAFNYASVFFLWIVLRKQHDIPKYSCLFIGLVCAALYFFVSTAKLWYPIAQGGQMNEHFALGFVQITLYSNVVGLLCGLFGYQLGKAILARSQQLNQPNN